MPRIQRCAAALFVLVLTVSQANHSVACSTVQHARLAELRIVEDNLRASAISAERYAQSLTDDRNGLLDTFILYCTYISDSSSSACYDFTVRRTAERAQQIFTRWLGANWEGPPVSGPAVHLMAWRLRGDFALIERQRGLAAEILSFRLALVAALVEERELLLSSLCRSPGP